MSGRNPIGLSDEWFTPARVFAAFGCRFDLDVASPAGLTTHVPADRFITAGSLDLEWTGFVWMNPPFGGRNEIAPWLDKLIAHGDGIGLTPDRTSAPWFQERARAPDALLFTPKIRFEKPDGTQGGSPFDGTCLWGFGARAVRALDRASTLGLGFAVVPGSLQQATRAA